ncbi:hypothetical protein RPMA_03820 [Tardiphaga alba]|uniref:GcrA cell cycle regulator n=1 Tax=Tardiphaga alba TaxID=340268 RepID=A0ABX8A4E0_9BRAD|nr:hypothetical protein [Tardiphaga alba]QUS38077.1 hypothetical protein RPMA_03820 [Tardiphaga alba]
MKPLSKVWTDQDIQRLRELAAEGATAMRAASALNRRSESVKKAARQHGLKLVGTREAKAPSAG